MSTTDLPIEVRHLEGWNRTTPTDGHVLETPDVEVIAKAVAAVADANADKPDYLRRGIIARGLGRSYNESGQNSGGLTVDMTLVNKIHSFDEETGIIEVDAGVSIDHLMKVVVPSGFWVPVMPGTRQVTIGGAIAHDIHGKNHHSQGSFGNHVVEMTLLVADGRVLTLKPEGSADDPDGTLFWSTVAGIGMTGIVLRAKIALKRTESAYFLADTFTTNNLDETIDLHLNQRYEDGFEYASGWFDTISGPPKLGRGSFSRGNLATYDELPEKLKKEPLKFDPKPLITLPNIFPRGLDNKFDFTLIGELYYKMGSNKRGVIESLPQFYHPLDLIGNWNNAYGRGGGFTQYQFIVPVGNEDEFKKIITDIQASGHISFLNVIKLFGEGNKAPMSFPHTGWNVCLDFPLRPGLAEFLNEMDLRIMEMGGRLYTAKDARTSAEHFHQMYPKINDWIATRRSIDPNNVFISDMGRRLELL